MDQTHRTMPFFPQLPSTSRDVRRIFNEDWSVQPTHTAVRITDKKTKSHFSIIYFNFYIKLKLNNYIVIVYNCIINLRRNTLVILLLANLHNNILSSWKKFFYLNRTYMKIKISCIKNIIEFYYIFHQYWKTYYVNKYYLVKSTIIIPIIYIVNI